MSDEQREHSQKWNHPARGSTIKVEPIRSVQGINKIKEALADKPRDYCLFVLGINTALGHSTQRQTMEYLCIQEKEIENVYTAMEL